MAYGITSEAQLIDVGTITAGCNQYKQALEDFETNGNRVKEAGEVCNAKALSIDSSTIQWTISDLGEEIKNVKTSLSAAADGVVAEATRVYNEQVAELNEYRRRLAEEQARQQQASQNRGS